jgi:hypothetical protein
MTDLPQFENYGNYSSSNYGAHTLRFFDAAGNCYWFSYSTLVAFSKPGHPRVVHENDWGPTTGKHLNWIDGGAKKHRLNDAAFLSVFKDYFGEEIAA